MDILTKKLVRVATGTEPDQAFDVLGWRPDGSELLFLRVDRNRKKKKMDLMAANPSTGSTRIILTESRGFWRQLERLFTPLEDGARFI